MNEPTYAGLVARLLYRGMLSTRYLGAKPVCESIGATEKHDKIQRIYVINLDREANRWRRMRRELGNVFGSTLHPIATIARRFSAIDARYHKGRPDDRELHTSYLLADQLFVEPNPQLTKFEDIQAQPVEM